MSEQTPIVNDNRSHTYSTRQRIVIVTFPNPEVALLFDGLSNELALKFLAEPSVCTIDRQPPDTELQGPKADAIRKLSGLLDQLAKEDE